MGGNIYSCIWAARNSKVFKTRHLAFKVQLAHSTASKEAECAGSMICMPSPGKQGDIDTTLLETVRGLEQCYNTTLRYRRLGLYETWIVGAVLYSAASNFGYLS